MDEDYAKTLIVLLYVTCTKRLHVTTWQVDGDLLPGHHWLEGGGGGGIIKQHRVCQGTTIIRSLPPKHTFYVTLTPAQNAM